MVAYGEHAAYRTADYGGRRVAMVAADGIPDVVEVVAEVVEGECSLSVPGRVCWWCCIVVTDVVVAEGLVACFVEGQNCGVIDVMVCH